MTTPLPSSVFPLPALARLESLSARGMKLGLAAIDAVCGRLGRPERRVPSVLIAGTNGKGSTAATLSSIASAAGIRAGLYTSPHLIEVTERVRIEEADVSPGELDCALAAVFEVSEEAPEVPLTYFEALTAAAFVVFAERRLDLAILEVGLGGRFDATNIAPACLSAVTSISKDHTEELGPTIASIAREKAGVFRRGKPALVESPLEEAREVFRAVAAETGAWLHEMAREVSVDIQESSLDGTGFRLQTPERAYELKTPLPGDHQAGNAATAVRAAELLGREFRVDPEAIPLGVRSARWPGRLEKFLVRGRRVLLDGCHNAGGAACLGAFLAGGPEADLVFGAMADKDIEEMVGALSGVVGDIFLVPVRSPRAATPEELVRRVRRLRPDARPVNGLEEALEELLRRPGDKPIMIAGSLYLVGEARALLLSGRLERR